jgi:tetratricopeptide (TPR) repeat protein
VLRQHRHRADDAKKYDEAEAAYKKAIELKPDFAEAYNGLANVYNARRSSTRRPKRARRRWSWRRAAGGGAARGARRRRQRVAGLQPGRHPLERRQDSRGEGAVRAGGEGSIRTWPTRATGSAWRWSTAATPAARRKPHFETYLKLAPTGQYADTAKASRADQVSA